MDCPKCLGILKEKRLVDGSIVVDQCPICGGIWFDAQELSTLITRQLLEKEPIPVEIPPINDEELLAEIDLNRKEIACPRCNDGRAMIRQASPRNRKITIDYCENCEGIWLDQGEYGLMRRPSFAEGAATEIVDFFRRHFPGLLKRS